MAYQKPVQLYGRTTADGLANIEGGNALAHLLGYNGSTWDRWRNNTQGTLLASAERTAAVQSANVTNYNANAAILFLDVTAASGTGGLSIYFDAKDSVTGKYFRLNAAPSAIIATGSFAFMLAPGVSGKGADVSQITGGVISPVWRVRVNVGDASAYTYSIGYALIV